jgi:uncharacterized protein YndB with AHSA1/START domain
MIRAVRTINAVATSSGSPDDVWSLLADASTWAQWGAWSSVEIEGGGQQGPGSVRVLVKAPFRLRERVTSWEPGKRMEYELLDGMRASGYKAEVTLEPSPQGGTVIRWHSTYRRAAPLTALVLRFAVPDACKRLAKAASR